MKNILLIIFLFIAASVQTATADSTGTGKIVTTQGHVAPNCRMVLHRSNDSGTLRWFRIQDVPTDDDVSAIVLSALMGNRDVVIYFEEGQTTGCGNEPRIIYISIY